MSHKEIWFFDLASSWIFFPIKRTRFGSKEMSREMWGHCSKSLLHFSCSEIPKNNSSWIKTLSHAVGSSAIHPSLLSIIAVLTDEPSDSMCPSLLPRKHSILLPGMACQFLNSKLHLFHYLKQTKRLNALFSMKPFQICFVSF